MKKKSEPNHEKEMEELFRIIGIGTPGDQNINYSRECYFPDCECVKPVLEIRFSNKTIPYPDHEA